MNSHLIKFITFKFGRDKRKHYLSPEAANLWNSVAQLSGENEEFKKI